MASINATIGNDELGWCDGKATDIVVRCDDARPLRAATAMPWAETPARIAYLSGKCNSLKVGSYARWIEYGILMHEAK